MKESQRRRLHSIERELGSIIRQLKALSGEVNGEFKGIGESALAEGIENIASKYEDIRNQISSLE